MKQTIAVWILSLGLVGIGQMTAPPAGARELELETFGMLSYGMTEAEVVGRAGQPDRRLDQFEPTPLNQQLVSYQYIWGGDTSKGEWTTTITFSAKTSKVIRIDRDRK
ncbi:MAG TPA: hypothetical protein VGQ08_02545 [Nitrospiraceae bacterium]|nr:hypothetical protein [Nitrospiraceae bacterium]